MTPTHEPEIVLDGVSKWYGQVLGLNEVTATFTRGVTGLLGPNGAGKSTLMKLVCGMLRPSLGSVTLCGVSPRHHPEVLRRLGLCPEQDAAQPGVSALDVTAYLTRLHGFPAEEARARAERALERVGLADVMHRSAAGYSKGQKQRAKLAQALAHEPDVLVLDEPLNGLDPIGRRELGRLIRHLGDEGRCVLVSSHILHELEAIADRMILLHTGRVLAEGTVSQIREDLPEYPLTVRVSTTTPVPLAQRLVALEGVHSVERGEKDVTVVTARPAPLFEAIAAVVEDGVAVEAIEPLDEDLEAVFRYLTR